MLSIIQDTKREQVPAGPVPDALREHAEPVQDVTAPESSSSSYDDVQNTSQDEDSHLKWPEDQKSIQIPDENNSDVRDTNYLLTVNSPNFDFREIRMSEFTHFDWVLWLTDSEFLFDCLLKTYFLRIDEIQQCSLLYTHETTFRPQIDGFHIIIISG